jgi:two-component system phosphate regulon sensor histidine kinase PhoR
MKSSILRRFLLVTQAIVLITCIILCWALTRWAGDGGLQFRIVLAWLVCALLAAGLVWLVSLPLIWRVRRLKQVAEGLLEIPRNRDEAGRKVDEMRALERSLSGVAEQVRALVDKLRLESARREAILAGMAEGVLAVDSEMRIIFSNEAMSRAVGGSRRIQEKTRLLELIRDTGLFETLREVMTSGGLRKYRLKITSDKERSFEVLAGPLEIPGGQGAMAILHDMTDLERLEQVRKDFVANVSHEMRTPLAGIIGYSETLLDGALEDEENNRRFLQIIHSSAIRLNSIASDLLVLSELESKVDPPEAGRIPVRDVVESALAIVENEASARGVTLICEEIQDVHVMGTRLRLEQAVLNLVANAIKFNQPGGEVRIRAVAEPAGDVSITIADTGVGIPSQDLPRIFERFYRVDKGRSRQVGGTGLGLTIVKHVIERMNGTIEVQSQLKNGSTFTVRLPLATDQV